MIDIDALKEKIDERIKENIDDLNDEIERDIVYSLLSGDDHLYEVDHNWDPPWDHSGQLVKNGHIDTDEVSFSEYLELYDGSSYPSFFSGCGMFHRTNDADIDDMIMEVAFDIQNDVIVEMISAADRRELYDWLTSQRYNHLDVKSFEEFVDDFDDCVEDICFTITDMIDGETMAFYTYEIVKLLSVFQENPMLSELIRRHGVEVMAMIERDRREAVRQARITKDVNEQLGVFLSDLKKLLPDTNSFFNGRKIEKGKDCKNLRKRFFDEFTKDEIALIAYFEPYHFSNSILAELSQDVKKMIDDERARLRAIYEQKYPPEQKEV